jgi:hypothetical protein
MNAGQLRGVVMPDRVRVQQLIDRWIAYRAGIPEPGRYCTLKRDLYNVRNPPLDGPYPLTLIDVDDQNNAAVEHYFLTRCWVGTGEYPAWQVRQLVSVYNTGKSLGVTPRHNPNKPTTPPSEVQKEFQAKGIADGEKDLAASGQDPPILPRKPPMYY